MTTSIPAPSRRTYLLITGASSGIGQEMAIQLSKDHALILNGRNEERLQATVGKCHRPQDHLLWPFDLGRIGEVADQFTRLLIDGGRAVSGFVHCAGLLKILPMKNQTLPLIQETMNVNVLSAMEITNVLIKKKVNNHQLRSIIFISSIASQFGARGFSAYCASKGALDALMKALAVELAPRVRVNSILPGGIRTQMTAEIFNDPEMVAKFNRDYPLGIGDPSDVINMVEFLLSEKSRWITGQKLVVDGGRTSNITA